MNIPLSLPVTIRGATLRDGSRTDARIAHGCIVELGPDLVEFGDRNVQACGGLLLPGLHDHHVHVAATAVALDSVSCGPPEIDSERALGEALSRPGKGWLRGVGYYQGVVDLDRAWLDEVAPMRPVRVQHRSGRMWVFNSVGVDAVLASGLPPPSSFDKLTGKLIDGDAWVREALAGFPPAFDTVGSKIAAFGVTGVTDMGPSNDSTIALHFGTEHAKRAFPQKTILAGPLALGDAFLAKGVTLGPVKLHLHEASLPDFDATVELIHSAHARDRAIAVHCVTAAELAYTVAALREAGVKRGDRIEHASVAPNEFIAQMADLGIIVVCQPNFVFERGDAYCIDNPSSERPELYRLRAFRAAGVTLAGGTDTPFGRADPWAAMAAAVSRRTAGGVVFGEEEALSADEALDLFLADPLNLSQTRSLAVGMPADLCLLDRPWKYAMATLSSDHVNMTFIDGCVTYNRVD